MRFLLQFLVTAGIIYMIAAYQYIPGITVENGYASALIFAVVLSLVNLFLGTLLRVVTFPLRLLTLGLFSFVIALIVVKVADEFVPAITLVGAIPVIVVALVMSVTAFILKFFD